jgi:hypothetical protein
MDLKAHPGSPTQQKQKEAQRLESLALWIRRYGHTVKSLIVRANNATSDASDYIAWRSDGVSSVVKALAAAGQQKGRLQLQAPCLPAIGGTDPETLASALSVCPNLVKLQLDYCSGDETIHPVSYLGHELTAGLQGLQHLTHLKLTLSMTNYFMHTPEGHPWPTLGEEFDPTQPVGYMYVAPPTVPYLPDPFPPDQTPIFVNGFFSRLPASWSTWS